LKYLVDELFQVYAPPHLRVVWTGSIKPNRWAELAEKCKTRNLRQVAKEYDVSHETVRRPLRRIGMFDLA
jgi:hypothetical protein